MNEDHITILLSGIGGLVVVLLYIYFVRRAIMKAVNESEGPIKCELLEEMRKK